jgi:hypothetical protein
VIRIILCIGEPNPLVQKLEERWKQSRQNDFLMVQRIEKLQKDIYLTRRAELAKITERIEAEIQEVEKELHEMETAADADTGRCFVKDEAVRRGESTESRWCMN